MAWRSIGAFIGEDGTVYADVPNSTIDAIIRANLDASGAISYDEDWPGAFSLGNVHVALQGGYTSSMLDSPSVGRVTQEMNPGETIDYISHGYAIRFKDYNSYEYYMGIAADQSTSYYTSTAYVKYVDQDGTEVIQTMAPQCMCRPSGAAYMDYSPFQDWFVPTNYPWFYQTPKEPPEVGYDVHQDGTHTYANYIYIDDDTQQATVVTLEQLTKTAYLEPVEPRQWRVTLKGPSNNSAYVRGLLYNVLEETTPPEPPVPPEPEPPEQVPTPNPFENNTTGNEQIGGTGGNNVPTEGHGTAQYRTPTGSLGTGLTHCYVMDDGEISALGSDLYDNSVWEDIKEYFAQPADAIISLHTIPFDVGAGEWFDYASGRKNIKLADTTLPNAAGYVVTNRFAKFDLGKLEYKVQSDTYIDFDKYTKVHINLPYIGEQELNANLCENKMKNDTNGATVCETSGTILHLIYVVDVLTGAFAALLYIDDVLRYQWIGNCAATMPYSFASREAAASQFLSLIGNLGNTIATGALAIALGGFAGGPVGLGLAVGTIFSGLKTLGNAGTWSAAYNAGPEVHTNGTFGQLAGAVTDKYPYITITKPNVYHIPHQEHFIGYAAPNYDKVGRYVGFVQFSDVHIEDIPCSDEEKAEMMRLLTSGVLIIGDEVEPENSEEEVK